MHVSGNVSADVGRGNSSYSIAAPGTAAKKSASCYYSGDGEYDISCMCSAVLVSNSGVSYEGSHYYSAGSLEGGSYGGE